MQPPIRIVIVDDHTIVREGLHLLFAEQPEFTVVGEATNGEAALDLVRQQHPDVVVLDLLLPGMDGIEVTRRLQKLAPASRVLVLTSCDDDVRVRSALEAGAVGYLLKDVMKAELFRAVRSVMANRPILHTAAQEALIRHMQRPPSALDSLTEREHEVLRLIAQGLSNRSIALELHLTEGTVKGYVSTVLDKLNVADRTQAALYAVQHGVVALQARA